MKTLVILGVLLISGSILADDVFVGNDAYVSCRIDHGRLFPIHQIVTNDGSRVYREKHNDLLYTVVSNGCGLNSVQVENNGQILGSNQIDDFCNLVIKTQLTDGTLALCTSL